MKADRHTGERILRRRTELGLSQRDVVEGTPYSYAYLSRIESGQRIPSLTVLIELADALETSALFLATGRTRDCPLCGRA
jgi:transcriptional regulator with XRE-family HTH domain